MSEDTDPVTGEAWGNFPQTYSHGGDHQRSRPALQTLGVDRMSRLIVASNRVADLDKVVQSGGLAVALEDALQSGRGLWFGWDGSTVEEGEASLGIKLQQYNGIRTATIPLTRREYEEYYLGFSNRALWPTFHYRLDLAVYEHSFLEGYRRVNQRFAQSLAALVEPGDLIWVHDYHLIPLAEELRLQGVKEKIGFFLHIPFPSPDFFTAIPEHAWLAKSMFDYDILGFQTSTDAANFVRYVVENADGEALSGDRVRAFGKTVIARAFPIGIDADFVFRWRTRPRRTRTWHGSSAGAWRTCSSSASTGSTTPRDCRDGCARSSGCSNSTPT